MPLLVIVIVVADDAVLRWFCCLANILQWSPHSLPTSVTHISIVASVVSFVVTSMVSSVVESTGVNPRFENRDSIRKPRVFKDSKDQAIFHATFVLIFDVNIFKLKRSGLAGKPRMQ